VRDDRERLLDMLEAIERIGRYASRGREAFLYPCPLRARPCRTCCSSEVVVAELMLTDPPAANPKPGMGARILSLEGHVFDAWIRLPESLMNKLKPTRSTYSTSAIRYTEVV